ncbi:Nicotinamide mononucleotide adenylyltransferase [Lasiodiplodia hormozganensis]|uniref:Nicotinamide mononucleotide adenylyltransferase n=1 Tax=Lasiodiplodia hormozganensis TaxID=869390 RepID=A0AA39YA84_9PEZI|nr:Nicotinamide mononucleotide adenylyltransferase [Lasiodiplodia hormozganensis]
MADIMAGRIASMRAQLPELQSALHAFTSSSSAFRIVRTINPAASTPQPPKTLYILDSSFNPPSIAHQALATSAVTRPVIRDPGPHRILLLFSTHNADKAPAPASFEHRLAMMTLFAEDLSASLSNTASAFPSRSDVAIDIGLTKKPYYTDKSIAITTSQPNPYPSNPTHVHLIGYDTVTRFLASKYYPDHSPPLSALAPYFDPGHKILATLRPSDPNDSSSQEFGTTEQQIAYIEGLAQGSLAAEGFKPEWAGQVDYLVGQEGIGVSSTRIRKAAKAHSWDELQNLCTPGVAAWVENQHLYEENAKDAKMA